MYLLNNGQARQYTDDNYEMFIVAVQGVLDQNIDTLSDLSFTLCLSSKV
jgi:hypothetical protein